MKKYNKWIIVGAVMAGLIVWLNIALYKIREYKANEGKVVRDTTTIVKYDTLTISKPVYITQKVTDSVLVPITDTLRVNDTLYVQVPITQKTYAKDSVYKAWVSGYRPNLDSIQVYPKSVYQIITNTVYKKTSRIGFGVMGGYGVTFGDQTKLSPFIGVGLYYRIW